MTNRDDNGPETTVELTPDGDLRINAADSARFFPSDALVALAEANELLLVPLVGPGSGGLLLKQRNRAGDRSALVSEHLPPDGPRGLRPATWDPDAGCLRVDLSS